MPKPNSGAQLNTNPSPPSTSEHKAGRELALLIAEAALAIEMGANTEDLALTVHPHPTLSETVAFGAEMAEGTITDLYIPKRR